MNRRTFSLATGAAALGTVAARGRVAASPDDLLLVTNSAGAGLSWVRAGDGMVETVEVGASPWGMAVVDERTAYVATAEGVVVVDLARRTRTALIAYAAPIDEVGYGEYRPGGMGIAASPGGDRVYTGVHRQDGESQIEIIDLARGETIAAVSCGVRPFDVLIAADGGTVFAIDHDSYTVTMIDTATLATRTAAVAPFGVTGGFDKPHYGVLDARGHLLLPFQGQTLLDLDPETGETTAMPMTANTHQHGLAWLPDGRLAIVGTGPAGDAPEGPSLALFDPTTGDERSIPLAKPHEAVAIGADGRHVYLTGGYTFANGGWDGITVVDLETGETREIAVPDRPLAIALLAAQD